MADLMKQQQRLWKLLADETQRPPMLRLSRKDDCCWVCDLPRRVGECETTQRKLEAEGFAILSHAEDGLWHIDPCWQPATGASLPPFPDEETLHTAYALLRLLWFHPCSPEAPQPMPLVRAIAKQCCIAPEQAASGFETLYESCAQLLREGKTLPALAGPYLQTYLDKEETR